ncbi:AMP-binding protein [Frondihabitans sp. Leaf304]|uniref:AMP-binding protein n=1 Tax=Frondihabitans sp. Leaf304 TaxID=1736329 RepID=UPI0006F9D42B|nr:AMP-binding protein [Frondihabitans sp. Leaf304]KQQ27921.1 AMP-dependent synthetase [Frondihabitans sp. Leaf304]
MTTSPGTAAYRAARDSLIGSTDSAGSADSAAEAAAAVDSFEWPAVGDTFNWATDWFDVIARGSSRVALWIVEEDGRSSQTTYDEMATRSDQLATHLYRLGVGKGDHVLLMLGNQFELWETMLAVIKLGAVILPTSTMLESHDLQDRIDRGAVRHVITNADETHKFDTVTGDFTRIAVGGAAAASDDTWVDYPDSLDPEATEGSARPSITTGRNDACLVYFTSGTTSRPKMVVHTQVSYPVGHLSTMYWLGLRPGDVELAISSPGWGKHAWSCFFSPWIAEATVFVYNYGRFDAAALRGQLESAGVTTFCAPPTVWRLLIQADLGARPSSLREIVSAGEPLNPEVIARVEEAWGLTIRDGYGQTETTAIIGNRPGDVVKPGSMGKPLPGVAVTLIDPVTGEAGSEGEICLDLSAGPVNLMSGYFGDADRTAAALRDGVFHTGDVASRDDDGFITFIGRTDDVFKSSDYKVSPFEVESVLLEHPAVAESAVVPAPDDIKLNVVKAYVTLAAGWEPTAETALAVLGHARSALPAYERVRRVEFGPLPKTISGKIRRVELREREDRAVLPGAEPLTGEWRDTDFPELGAGRR